MVATVQVVSDPAGVDGLGAVVVWDEPGPIERIAELAGDGLLVAARMPPVTPGDEASAGSAIGFAVAAIEAGARALVTDDVRLARRVAHLAGVLR